MSGPPQEWLETNGVGGFACGTVTGELTRFWHALLWVARRPPADRVKIVLGCFENFEVGRRGGALSSQWPDEDGDEEPVFPPPAFAPRPMARWTWRIRRGVTLEKELFLPQGQPIVVIRYLLTTPKTGPKRAYLGLTPVVPTREDSHGDAMIEVLGAETRGQAGILANPPVSFRTELDCEDDAVRHIDFAWESVVTLTAGEPAWVVFSVGGSGLTESELASMYAEELRRRSALAGLPAGLALAADQFIVRRAGGASTIMAGYPWFTDWGRDTMISLPGLCLRTGRFAEAKSILGHFLRHADRGIIPNVFPEVGDTPQYNTIDATLWMFEAIHRYVIATGDADFLRENWGALCEVIRCHVAGTHNDIGVDDDGLLRGGSPGSQLTWMDVKVDGHVPTPRHGKPVEIQGLWYNALKLMAGGAVLLGRPQSESSHFEELAARAATAFRLRFAPIAGTGSLMDVVDRDGPMTADPSVRPNQVIPFALTYCIIPDDWAPGVLRAVAEKLLTPRGLRTLSADDPAYKGAYRGNVKVRDRAYHQGTVWMWLIWPFVRGVETHAERVPELAARLPGIREGLEYHLLHEGCLGSASEISDGDAPHTPRGCFAQAWSVAAIIEVLAGDSKRR